jgi:hypothetical protein
MSIINRGRELEKNLEGWRGLNDRRGVRGRRIVRERSMDAVTVKMRDRGKKVMSLAGGGEPKRRGDR